MKTSLTQSSLPSLISLIDSFLRVSILPSCLPSIVHFIHRFSSFFNSFLALLLSSFLLFLFGSFYQSRFSSIIQFCVHSNASQIFINFFFFFRVWFSHTLNPLIVIFVFCLFRLLLFILVFFCLFCLIIHPSVFCLFIPSFISRPFFVFRFLCFSLHSFVYLFINIL